MSCLFISYHKIDIAFASVSTVKRQIKTKRAKNELKKKVPELYTIV